MEVLQYLAIASGGLITFWFGLRCLLTNNPIRATNCGLVSLFGAIIFALGMV